MASTIDRVVLITVIGCLISGCRDRPEASVTPLVPLISPQTLRHLPQNAAPNALTAIQSLSVVKAERDRYWEHAQQEVDRSVLELMAQEQANRNRGLRTNLVLHGDPSRREIALTFDDGPHPDYTPRLLEVLRQSGVKATFFVVGRQAEKHPDLVRAIIRDGHALGNHTYDHISLIKIPSRYVATEIKACGEVLEGITGTTPRYFRPPGGEYDASVTRASETLGYKMVLWTDDPGDYSSPGDKVIVQRTLSHVRPGGILLLHDGIKQTIEVLPGLIRSLQREGYHFVTLDEMTRPHGSS